jgi:hypothetical protein
MTYAKAVSRYYAAGWRCIIPVPVSTKFPPPDGYTGAHGIDVIDPVQLAQWSVSHADYSVALRMPADVIALDIDHYDKTSMLPDGSTKTVSKRGADTITAYEEKWGPLPQTWASTARPDEFAGGTSRTLWFRVPVGRYATKLGDSVEILQRHHRYCVVWPSIHSEIGAPYHWYAPVTENATTLHTPAWRLPAPHELAELPPTWVAGLAAGGTTAAPTAASGSDGAALLGQVMADDRPACAEIENARLTGLAELAGAESGSRHDIATGRVYQVIRLGAFGHSGAGAVLDELADRWAELTAGEDRADEFERMCQSAACKAVTEVGSCTPIEVDPCTNPCTWRPPVPSVLTLPDDESEPEIAEDPEDNYPSVAEPVIWSRRALIGTHLFDPDEGLDQLLADSVLERTHPVLRYATDSGNWLLRGPYTWETCPDMAEWAVSELMYLMPKGDPDADKKTPERNRAERRKRFGSTGTGNAIAGKMRAGVRAIGHPCTVRLSELDSDPGVLWAGGFPWSLRRSLESPMLAAVDHAAPHLESAGVQPSGAGLAHPTPHWDAYTAAIWPDPQIREWALQVLAVGYTGYSDAVLPILLGNTGVGKTSIISLLMSTLGSYAMAADPRLLASIDNTHASIVIALKGKRFAFIDEGPREGKLATERLKQLTGGAELTGNSMRSNPVTFRPTHTLVLTCNIEQVPTFGDPALRRRVRLIPCEGDPVAVAQTRAAITTAVWHREAPGVLAAMMSRAGRWLIDRSVASREAAPESIRYRAEEIAADQDLVRQWIAAELEDHEDGTRSADLMARYADWTRRFRLSPPNPTAFGRKLTELGYPPIHQRDGNYRGLRPRQGPLVGPYVPPPTGTTAASADADTTLDGSPQMPDTSSTKDSSNAELLGQSGDTGRSVPTQNVSSSAISEDQGSCGDQIHEMSGLHKHTKTDIGSPHVAMGSLTSDEGTLRSTVKGVNSCEGLGQQPFTGSDQEKCSVCEGLKGFSSIYSPHGKIDEKQCLCNSHVPTTEDHTTISREIYGNYPSHPSTLHRASPDQAVLGREDPEQPLTDPSRPSQDQTITSGAQTRMEQPGDPEALRARLASQRAARNELSARIRKIKKTDPARAAELEAERDQLKITITETAKQLTKLTKAAQRSAAVAEVAGRIVPLPALKVRGQLPVSVDLLAAAGAVREAVARDGGRCTVDIESTGYPIGHPDHAVQTVQLGDWWTGVVFDVADVVQFATATLLLAEAPELQAYSAAVELSHLAHIGMLDFDRDWPRVHDVVIPAQLDNPIGTLSSEAGLKEQSELRMPDTAVSPAADAVRADLFRRAGWLTDTKIKGGGWCESSRSGWAMVDKRCAAMVDYAASDVLDTAALARVLPAVPARVYARERAVQAAVAGVSYHGLRLDGPHIDAMIAKCEPERDKAYAGLTVMGIDNPGSNDQVAAALIARGARLRLGEKSGKPSVAADVLADLPRTPELTPVIDQILDYRHWNRQLTTYLRPYQLLVRYGDGRMRSVVYTLQADTGRMSCVHENLQNIPTHGGIRECLTADHGDLFVDADLSGVEVAVLAALSQDPTLLEIVHGKKKLHKIIAEIVFGPEYTAKEYGYVKNGVFAKFYGAGIEKVAATAHCSLQVAQSMTDVLDDMAPVAKQWGHQWRNAVKNGTTQYELYSGRVLHLPQRFPHKVMNYLIQGTAREIFVDGLLKWANTRWGKYKVTVPVHDEILSSVPANEAPEAMDTLAQCMSTELYGVRIGAEPKWSEPSWRWLGNDAA